MKLTIEYLKYIIEHKVNVFIEGRKLGLGIWQLLKHDLSKLSRYEFKQYRDYFFGIKNSESKRCFNEAWQHHKHKNKHHWQYWIDIKDNSIKPIEIPLIYEVEMIADWRAMSRKFAEWKTSEDIRKVTYEWYKKQTDIILHPITRVSVEFYFENGYFTEDLGVLMCWGNGLHDKYKSELTIKTKQP